MLSYLLHLSQKNLDFFKLFVDKLIGLISENRATVDGSFMSALFWVQHLFTYFYISNEAVLSFLQADLASFNKAKAQISDMKKDVEDKIAKCQSNTVLEAIS